MSPPSAAGKDFEAAASSADEDKVEALIRSSGCWDKHIAVVDCMGDKRDWRLCQDDLKRFRECMTKRPPAAKPTT
ncbi:Protein T20D3.3 c [Aphelenchoides avenae]|nr:Protein T20D3.3 c [Aphelenchus avenae]